MSKILVLVNHDIVIHYFRSEVMTALVSNGFRVMISCPREEKTAALEALGCEIIETAIDRKGTNPIKDVRLLRTYIQMIRRLKPDIVLTFTIKPNVYGGIACRCLKTPYIPNITGLGTAVENPGLLRTLTTFLYKNSLKTAQIVFFQNEGNKTFFLKKKIALGKHELLPGSGVNLKKFTPLPYPSEETIEFVFISRIMKDKGIDEYLGAAKVLKERYPNTQFHVCGNSEKSYVPILKEYDEKAIVQYHGLLDDVRLILQRTHCTVHPSYHEGMSNVLLESSACARPVITTNKNGCKEVVDEGVNGFLVPVRDTESLIEAVERFILLSYEQKVQMGLAGRKKVEREFDRQIVVDAYMREISHILGEHDRKEHIDV